MYIQYRVILYIHTVYTEGRQRALDRGQENHYFSELFSRKCMSLKSQKISYFYHLQMNDFNLGVLSRIITPLLRLCLFISAPLIYLFSIIAWVFLSIVWVNIAVHLQASWGRWRCSDVRRRWTEQQGSSRTMNRKHLCCVCVWWKSCVSVGVQNDVGPSVSDTAKQPLLGHMI